MLIYMSKNSIRAANQDKTLLDQSALMFGKKADLGKPSNRHDFWLKYKNITDK